MDKPSSTLLLLLASSVVLTLSICIGIYISNQPQLQFIWLYSSSHPVLALNLLILLIIVSSHCFAISRNTSPSDHRDDRDELLLSEDSTHRITQLTPNSEERIANARRSKSKKQKSREGSHLRQLNDSHVTTEDNVKPPEMLTQRTNDEVTSSASSSSSSARLRKEVSLTKEEVNRRVERFIRKFNDD